MSKWSELQNGKFCKDLQLKVNELHYPILDRWLHTKHHSQKRKIEPSITVSTVVFLGIILYAKL